MQRREDEIRNWKLENRSEILIRWEDPPAVPGRQQESDIYRSKGQGPGKDPSPVPRPLGKARGVVHPLPPERANSVLDALRRAMAFSLSRGERVAEGRGRVRGLCPPVAVRPL